MSWKETIHATIERIAPLLDDLAQKIHASPELGLEEVKAVRWQEELLRSHGFAWTSPFANLTTAYRASRGTEGPVVCFMAEYDALPEIGHACGHNLIAPAAIGGGIALAEALESEKIPGTVVVMGTPAEESRGGKIQMIRNGALQGIDVAFLAHPFDRTCPDPGGLGVRRYTVTFYGRSSHASLAPEKGLNALDGVLLLFQGINAWRQHLPEPCRIHGIITEGGVRPNIVPERASCDFFLRAPTLPRLELMEKRFRDIARGAALMTETEVKVVEMGESYLPEQPNPVLNEAFWEIAVELGLQPIRPKREGRGSSDFGDVTHVIPGIQFLFGITDGEAPLHSLAFCKAAMSELALARMHLAAEALARLGFRYCNECDFRNRVREAKRIED